MAGTRGVNAGWLALPGRVPAGYRVPTCGCGRSTTLADMAKAPFDCARAMSASDYSPSRWNARFQNSSAVASIVFPTPGGPISRTLAFSSDEPQGGKVVDQPAVHIGGADKVAWSLHTPHYLTPTPSSAGIMNSH